MEKKLYEQLIQYSKSDAYPFHMPGHKRNLSKLPEWNSYAMDITEIDGFDNLHDAQGILADTMKEIALFRGARKSYLLVNGSSGGLLSAISACVAHGDEIIVARNCHKAVYHAIYMNELQPHYIYPHYTHNLGITGGIFQHEIEKMLITFENVKAIVVTSPTYEGVVSDIKGIVEVAHSHHIPVIVDQAHGAHFGMGEGFPKTAMEAGADLVVESVHKTLPAPTQTALLHFQGELVDSARLEKFLGIYQTSSPSYPMMAAVAWCMDYCKRESKKEFVRYEERLLRVRRNIRGLEMIELFDAREEDEGFGAVDYDMGKLVFGVKDQWFSGAELQECLRERYHLELEMASLRYVIAMTSVMDTEEGLQRLYEALKEINAIALRRAQQDGNVEKQPLGDPSVIVRKMEQALTIYDVERQPGRVVAFEKAAGMISKEYVYLYPPGIPLVVPGEILTKDMIAYIKLCMEQRLEVKGLLDGTLTMVSKENS